MIKIDGLHSSRPCAALCANGVGAEAVVAVENDTIACRCAIDRRCTCELALHLQIHKGYVDRAEDGDTIFSERKFRTGNRFCVG